MLTGLGTVMAVLGVTIGNTDGNVIDFCGVPGSCTGLSTKCNFGVPSWRLSGSLLLCRHLSFAITRFNIQNRARDTDTGRAALNRQLPGQGQIRLCFRSGGAGRCG